MKKNLTALAFVGLSVMMLQACGGCAGKGCAKPEKSEHHEQVASTTKSIDSKEDYAV